MSRVFLFTILGGLVIAVITAINIRDVNAPEDNKFIPISVLSKKQANYGVDANLLSVPAVSADILEDKIRDTELESSVPIIRYTSLPSAQDEATDQDNTQSSDLSEPHNDQGNSGNGEHPQGGGGNSDQNKNNNEKNDSNNGQGKETRPEKKDLPENQGNKFDKPGKTK